MVKNSSGAIIQYNGTIDTFQKVFQHEGFQGLYKGIGLSFMKVLPSVAVSWTIYESLKKHV
jgi:solute carrier family 25 phosphate transporter 23/24/25/41